MGPDFECPTEVYITCIVDADGVMWDWNFNDLTMVDEAEEMRGQGQDVRLVRLVYVDPTVLIEPARNDGSECGPVGSTAPADPHTTGFDTNQP